MRVDVICKRNKVTLPNLPYDFKDLEPIISRDIMQIHHSKHHAAYVNNYNAAEEKLQQAVAQGISLIIYELQIDIEYCCRQKLNAIFLIRD